MKGTENCKIMLGTENHPKYHKGQDAPGPEQSVIVWRTEKGDCLIACHSRHAEVAGRADKIRAKALCGYKC